MKCVSLVLSCVCRFFGSVKCGLRWLVLLDIMSRYDDSVGLLWCELLDDGGK